MNTQQTLSDKPPPASQSGSVTFWARARWNPYLIGVLLGVLSWLVFAVVNKPLGVSTSVSAASAACAVPFVGMDSVQSNSYFAKHMPKWDYGMLFLVGIFGGALASSLLSRSFRLETMPQVWRDHFGPSRAKRMLAAFVGGVLTLYGARMAGGCTSGHGISGSLQLALSSWIFFITMFIAGVITAFAMFHRRRLSSIE